MARLGEVVRVGRKDVLMDWTRGQRLSRCWAAASIGVALPREEIRERTIE